MALTANVYLEINNTTKKIRVVDASNYTEEGIDLAALSAKGLGILSSPTGTAIYNGSTIGSPLVNLSATTTSTWFDLPLDSNGDILNGTYSFTYNLRYAISSGVINSITAPSTAELEFTWAGRVLIEGDSVVFVDNGDSENNGTFTVDSATFDEGSDNSEIIFTQSSLVTDATPAGTYSFDVTRANFAGSSVVWNGCNMVNPSVTVTYDCESTQFGSITFQDSTVLNGQTVVSRSLSGYYPNGLYPAPTTNPQTTSATSLTFSELAVGTWTHVLVLNMSVSQSDGLVYTYQVRDTGETLVSCVGTLCGLTPCIESLKDKYNASYVKGQDSGLNSLILLVLQLYALAKEYKTCGETEKYAATVAQLESVLDESGQCSCGCCDENKDVPYWVDNSNLDATSIITELQEQIDELNLQVGGLENAVQTNASALSAYNAIMALIAQYDSQLLGIVAQVSEIQSLALSLDPNSPTFEDDVDQLEAWLLLVEADFVDLTNEVDDIVAAITQFNIDFPDFSQYTINALEYLDDTQQTIVDVQSAIDALQVLLVSLTPSTYLDDIQDIWDAIAEIVNYLNTLTNYLADINLTLQNIQTYLSELTTQVINIETNLNNLIAEFNSLSKIKLLGAYVEDTDSANLYIPPAWMNQKIWYKFNIKGVSTEVGAEIKIYNPDNSYTLLGVSIGNNVYDIELDLVFVPADNLWKIGGVANIGGTISAVGNFTIDPITDLPFDVGTVIQISSTGTAGTNTFYALDGIAYKY